MSIQTVYFLRMTGLGFRPYVLYVSGFAVGLDKSFRGTSERHKDSKRVLYSF